MLELRLQQRIDSKKARLDALRPLKPAAVEKLREVVTAEWTHHSNAIEGNTLSLRETHVVLTHGVTIGGKTLREHFEALGHRDAIRFVEALAGNSEPITPHIIRQIHALVMSKIDDASTGKFRTADVRIAGVVHAPPPATDVPARMRALCDEITTRSDDHPVARAALAHHQFASTHPFEYGNGRTGRLLLNLLLMRAGYPPAIIQHQDRHTYYRALAHADEGRIGVIANFIGLAVDAALSNTLRVLDDASLTLREPRAAYGVTQGQYVSLAAAAKGTPYSQEYLSLLARKGRLDAMKRGRNWFTTREAVAAYQASVEG